MKTTLNINLDTAMMVTVAASLKNSELGRLFRAITARMAGEDAEVHLNNSGLRLAFALLGPSIDDSLQRLALNRANGAKGGRPRKHPVDPVDGTVETQNLASPCCGTAMNMPPTGGTINASPVEKNQEETLKKSKKEDLSPTPPIEEKIKKNNSAVVVDSREELEQEIFNNDLKMEQACMSLGISPDEYRQMARAVLNEWEFTEESDRSYKHLLNSLRIKAREQQRNKHQYHETRLKTRRDITDTAAVSAKDYEGPF